MVKVTGPGTGPPSTITDKSPPKQKPPKKSKKAAPKQKTRQQPSRKGKEKAHDVIEDEESESESDVPQPRKSKPNQKQTKKKTAKPKPVKKKPSSSTLMRLMEDMEFTQTKWADETILTKLGILGDVQLIFENMGLGSLLRHQHHAYESQTQQFLATLELYDDTSKEMSDPERAYITFRIDSVDYKMTLYQIATIMGFAFGGEVSELECSKHEAATVWRCLSVKKFKIGACKSTSIGHPSIRYAHALLTTTLFARKETGYVKEEELALLIEGLKPYLQQCSDGVDIIGQTKRLNLSHFLVNRFLSCKEWVHTHRDKNPQISIGGLITPLLRSVGVELGDNNIPLEFIDAQYLTRKKFLAGRVKTRYLYRFQATPDDEKKILLPHRNLTRIDFQGNIPFRPRPYHLYSPLHDGPPTAIPRYYPEQEGGDEAGPSEPAQPEEAQTVYGTQRYHFHPYDEPIAGKALQAAHEKINLLQRWVKYQDKVIKKLIHTVKGKFKRGKNGSKRKDKEHVEDEEAEVVPETDESETERDMERRHSYHDNRSTTLTIREPPRPSSHETRPQRKRRAPRSPSSSSSGNPVPSMDTSSSST